MVDWGQDGPTSDHPSAESEILRRSDEIAGFSDGGTFEPRQHSYRCCSQATDQSLAFSPSAVHKNFDDDCAALRCIFPGTTLVIRSASPRLTIHTL